MSEANGLTSERVERLDRRLDELRRSFDDDIRCAPPQDLKETAEYLLLTLADEAFAYPVACALEVIAVPAILPVPSVPPSVLGIINFRGQIVSVTTIHGLLGLAACEVRSSSRLIVTKGLPMVTGILADSVEKIVEIASEDIRPLPATVTDERARLLSGQVYAGDRVVFLLDMERLCGSESLRVTRADAVN